MKFFKLRILASFVLGVSATRASGFPEKINLIESPRGVVAFPHLFHAADLDISCEKCHHNISFVPTGEKICKGCHLNTKHRGLCHECHISNRRNGYEEEYEKIKSALKKDEVPFMYKVFHSLCRDCHAEANKGGKKAPYQCEGCHKA